MTLLDGKCCGRGLTGVETHHGLPAIQVLNSTLGSRFAVACIMNQGEHHTTTDTDPCRKLEGIKLRSSYLAMLNTN